MASDGAPNAKQTRFIAALLSTGEVRAAARMSGIGERTAWRWLGGDAVVRGALRRQQDAILAATVAGVVAAMGEAREVLLAVMRDSRMAAGVRVRAASVLWDGGLRAIEALAFAERLSRVEALIAERVGDAR